MTPTSPRIGAALAVAAVLLAGCSGDPLPETPTASTVPSASPAPTSTLSAQEQQAVDEAAAVVLARHQLVYDLLVAPGRPLNDLNGVVAQPQLERDLASLRKLSGDVAAGALIVEATGPVAIADVEPVKVDLTGDPPTVTLLVCMDLTSASGTEDGKPWAGRREAAEYKVVKVPYLPAPGWAVSRVAPPDGFDQPQPC